MPNFILPFSAKFLPLFLLIALTGCSQPSQQTPKQVDDQLITLNVGSLYGPTTYTTSKQEASGFDYDLIKAFASYLKLPLKFHIYPTQEALFQAMEKGDIDIMAAGLTASAEHQRRWRFGPSMYEVTPLLIYQYGQGRPAELAALDDTLMVAKGGYHAELLQLLKKQHPDLEWVETSEHNSQQLLAMVSQEQLAYTVTDSAQFETHRRFYPNLRVAFELGEPAPVAWAFNKHKHDELFSQLFDFWHQNVQGQPIARMQERYFGHVQGFDFVDTRAFIRAAQQRLPQYRMLFEQYAGILDWRKLAAVSYQESHWDPEARSPTGVRGMMMLTLPTAERMGIANRLDVEQSIKGGSEYLQELLGRLPKNIPSEEAIWFAMAAYNIGLGHLEDARVITERAGKDPNSWMDVKLHLPLLRKPEYYKNTRYGFARGDEAAHYVDNIRRYYDTLVWLDSQSHLPDRMRY